MQENKIKVYELSKNPKIKEDAVVFIGTKDQVENFISHEALRLNYGFYRCWSVEEKRYFDCGPVTYYYKD